jgi:hypothetical protein
MGEERTEGQRRRGADGVYSRDTGRGNSREGGKADDDA